MHKTTIVITLILLTLTILITHKYTLVFLAENLLKTNNIQYSKVQGTLFDGVILYDVKYKNILRAKKIQINYKLLSLVQLKPIIKNIQTNQLKINLDNLPTQKTTTAFKLIPFKILKINLKKSEFVIAHKKYFFDLNIKNLYYDKTFNTQKVYINLKSYYANATINATIIKNRLVGTSSNVKITKAICNKYLTFIEPIPKKLKVDLDIDTKKVQLKTHIDHLTLTADKNITISDQDLNINYLIDENLFELKDHYAVNYLNYISIINQEGSFNLKGEYQFQINTQLTNPPKTFPVSSFDANILGSLKSIVIDMNASDFILKVKSNDYNKYQIKLKNKKLKLSFIDSLPKKLKEHLFNFNSYSSLTLSPFTLDTMFNSSDKIANMNGTFKYTRTSKNLTAQINPNTKNHIYDNYNLKLVTPFRLSYKEEKKKSNINNSMLKIDANLFKFFISRDNNKLKGYGNLASTMFTLKGTIKDTNAVKIKVHTIIPSVKQLLDELKLTTKNTQTDYNGEIHINSSIELGNTFSINSTISAPYLSAQTNSQNLYVLKDIQVRSSYKNRKMNIYNYKAKYKEQKFYSDKLSLLHLDTNETIIVDKFYIYDNLILKGIIDPFESRMKLNLHSDKFHFNANDIKVTAKTNININVENTQEQVVDGNITLIDGTISYLPQHDYAITDDDIIIVQDIKRQTSSNLRLHVNINSLKPIKYKTKEINVKFIPKITLKKQPAQKLKVYGKATIVSGSIISQSKEFTFDKSEFLFSGQKHLNPKLNLKLHYQTVDYKDIIILITNTLNSPILIFSSNPAMSQNDIMSYILFDEPADTLFDNSGTLSKTSINYLLLGTGIKTIFNQTTGIHVDTLNILNNENGTLGYEVGARFNKKIRILYKNDISSSVVIQYSLTKSLRVDVDVHDTGQGVSFIYTKDFKGF